MRILVAADEPVLAQALAAGLREEAIKAMTLTRAMFDVALDSFHQFGERSHREMGAALPHLLLLGPGLATEAIFLPLGAPDAAGIVVLARRAARLGAVAALFTTQTRVGVPFTSPEAFAGLRPAGLARPNETDTRLEGVVTSAVWPAGHTAAQLISIIDRGPLGSRLRTARPMSCLDSGTDQWLENLLPSPR